MSKSFEDILDLLPEIKRKAEELKEILLANLVMIGEIPAPTFDEEQRIEFLINRFKEADISKNSVDEVGNGIGILEGKQGDKNILVVAHADTVFDANVNHTIQVESDKITGPGVADNSLGLSVMASLPLFLEELDIELENNLILMGATRSLGRGNLEGVRFFLSHFDRPITAGLAIEGIELGRLSHTSIGMKRGIIHCEVPETYDWSRFGDASAILTLNEVINRINKIKLPQRPRTSIVMGSIKGGTSFNTIALNADLRFEIRSESSEMVYEIHHTLQEIIAEVSSRSGDSITMDVFAQREPGGISFSHPLVRKTRQAMNKLGVEPHPGPSTSELSALIDHEIPSITLGVTHGDHVDETTQSIEIEPIYTGIAQIIGTLLAIDGGFDEED